MSRTKKWTCGTASYCSGTECNLENATADVRVEPDGRAKVVLTCGAISRTYEGVYDPASGTIGEHVFIRPFDGFGMEAHGKPRLYEGGVSLRIHDAITRKTGSKKTPEIRELLVFSSDYESNYPELDPLVTWNRP